MEHAKAEWNKRSLTDEAWPHRALMGQGANQKTKKKENETRGTRAQAGMCQGGEVSQARGVIQGLQGELGSKFKGEVEVSPSDRGGEFNSRAIRSPLCSVSG